MKRIILLCCYVTAILAYLAGTVGVFCWDRFLFATGRLETTSLQLGDFESYDLAVTGEMQAVAAGNDPQLILSVEDLVVRNMCYDLQEPAHGENGLYYTLQGQDDFSKKQIVLAPFGETEQLQYRLPIGKNYSKIRLDIGSTAGESFAFESIRLNEKLPVTAYLKISVAEWCALAGAPLLLGSFLVWGVETLTAWRGRKE